MMILRMFLSAHWVADYPLQEIFSPRQRKHGPLRSLAVVGIGRATPYLIFMNLAAS
ncbi:hypothetical protein [Devosia sp. A449]